MTLAIMTRASLGHTGQPLSAGRLTQTIYALVILAAAFRIAAACARLGSFSAARSRRSLDRQLLGLCDRIRTAIVAAEFAFGRIGVPHVGGCATMSKVPARGSPRVQSVRLSVFSTQTSIPDASID
jgi:hypothetical protein